MNGNIPAEKPEDKLLIMSWIGRTAKLMYVYMNQLFKEYGIPLTPKQWILLKHLIRCDGQDQKHLALITERDKTSLTRLISSMEKKGLVTRKPNPKDKRSNSIFITDKGAQAFYAADPIADDVRNIFEKGFDQQKLTVAVEVIQTLHDHLKELTSQNGEDQCDS